MANPISAAAKSAPGGILGGPVGVLAAAGVGALGSIFSSKSQSGAQNNATKAQADYNAKALTAAQSEQDYQRQQDAIRLKREQEMFDYTKGRDADNTSYTRGQRADYLGRLKPFNDAGAAAITGLSRGLGGQIAGTVPTNGGGQMVALRDKRGVVRMVPAAHAQHYIQQGAVPE